jgi:hypothetical protein
MQHYAAESYGDAIAAVFDVLNEDPSEVARIVAFLGEYAGDGPVLEPGIGTGRIGIPLAAGVEVYGVDISLEMVNQLLSKPGGEKVTVQVGDMNVVDFNRKFSMVYLVQGTFGALLTAERQRQFLRNVREQLSDAGRLIVETVEIDDSRFSDDQYVRTSRLDVGLVLLDAAMRDPENQLLSIQNVLVTTHRTQLFPLKVRYYTARELDLMASGAGLQLVERYSDWEKSSYYPGNLHHISVYGPR